jgi:pyranose oxidase
MPTSKLTTDVLIAGSGPIGCTFARGLVSSGRSVVIAEAGGQHSARPGEHLKNAFVYQRDIDRFTPIVQGLLQPLSVSSRHSGQVTANLDPMAFRATGSTRNAQNPDQDPTRNLPAAAVAYGVGGMFTHWTNNCPRYHPSERAACIPQDEWAPLYELAEGLLGVRTDVFEKSVRHTVVKETLRAHYEGKLDPDFPVQELPIAARRRTDNDEFVSYTGADTILGPLLDANPSEPTARWSILPHHRVTKLVVKGTRVDHAVVEDLMEWRTKRVYADIFVVAAGSILTPQILWNSRILPSALGRYLTEHPMAFTQVVLRRDVVEGIREDPRFREPLAGLRRSDPVPIPMHDPPPMVWIPVSASRPWHAQIHRDSFQYGQLPPDIDDRVVVDLRWFGMVEPLPENRVLFSGRRDKFGMPKPVFEFALGEGDCGRLHSMMGDMVEAAQALGGFLPGAAPQFMPLGSSLHFMGTYRMGAVDDGTSVVDPQSKVWGFDNLYLGGNGVTPTATAANPTLTSVAMAVRSISSITGEPAYRALGIAG